MSAPKNNKEIALAFKGMGGWKGLVKWARTNIHTKTQFYTTFGKSLLETTDDSFTPHADSSEQIAATIEQALLGVIRARHVHGDVATTFEIGSGGESVRIIDGVSKPYGMGASVSSDVRPHDIPHAALPVLPTPEPPPHDGVVPKPKPDIVARELTAAEARERALGPPNPPINNEHQPTSTELFLQWSGNARPTWSAPKGW
jgi:hypothetical protein